MKDESTLKQELIGQILRWKLGSASVSLQKSTAFSPETRQELETLLSQYREWDRIISNIRENWEENPNAAKMLLAEIPQEQLITHPAYRKIADGLKAFDRERHIHGALKCCEQAYAYILNELSQSKAEDALQSARQMVPNWQEIPELRERIETISEQCEKLGEGLKIQQEISSLRETGGLSAYQKALEKLNEYDALGLESYGISLFDLQEERDALLKMMVRADGSSWTFRLTPSSSQEILRLEQSIRSLEDAENKNLRVLINNNSRLLSILIEEMERLEPDSEQAIQASVRIQELRLKNQQLETDILQEAADRAGDYCAMVRQALEVGELKTAESNLRLARDAGKPAAADISDDFLGEVSLPVAVTDDINRLEDELARANKTRAAVRKELETIRKSYYKDEEITLNTLFSWKKTLEDCLEEDPHAPGLEQLLQEITDRCLSSRDYLLNKTIYDIDQDLADNDVARAKERLDSLNVYFSGDEQKSLLNDQLKKISDAENLRRQADTMDEEFSRLVTSAAETLSATDGDLQTADELLNKITTLYNANRVHESQQNTASRQTGRRVMQLLRDSANDIRLIKNAAAGGEVNDETRRAAEQLEASELYSLPNFCALLASFWKGCGQNETNNSLREQDFARACRLAADSGDETLIHEINAAVSAINEQNERGRRLNLLIDSLQQFYEKEQFIAGVDFIRNNVTETDRSDSQVQIWAEKIEQTYRMNQAASFMDAAKSAIEEHNLSKAEELIGQSLDHFYTVEAAQLQSTIFSLQEEEENSLRELQSFLSVDFNGAPFDEKTAGQIRYIRSRLQSLKNTHIRDLQLQGDLNTLDSQVELLINHESDEFNRLSTDFRTRLLAGSETLNDAGQILSEIENRNWIQNYRTEILEMKNARNNVERVYASLNTVIEQAFGFARLGDFRSARRMLNSFTEENLSALPGWLTVMKENAESRIELLDSRYQQVREKFDPDNQETNSILQEIRVIFENNVPDSDNVFLAQTELQRQRLILEKEIGIENKDNVYITSISYLEEVLNWAETIAEFRFGVDFPQEVFPMEPLYQIRSIGRGLYEKIPPLLIEIQPILARENKWLERRTRIRQVLQQINGCYTDTGKIKRSTFGMIEQEIENISLVVPLPEEKEALDETERLIHAARKKRSYLLAALISLVIILGAVYYFLPQIAAMLK